MSEPSDIFLQPEPYLAYRVYDISL